jgi:hypothetical protein
VTYALRVLNEGVLTVSASSFCLIWQELRASERASQVPLWEPGIPLTFPLSETQQIRGEHLFCVVFWPRFDRAVERANVSSGRPLTGEAGPRSGCRSRQARATRGAVADVDVTSPVSHTYARN